MYLPPPGVELGGSLQFQYIIIFQTWQSFQPYSSTPGRDRHMRPQTFLWEI